MIIFNKLAVLLGLNRKEAKGQVAIFEGIYGDHANKVLAARRAKNKIAKASRKRNRR